jgi:hypothetical protein
MELTTKLDDDRNSGEVIVMRSMSIKIAIIGRCKSTCMNSHADRDHAMCNIQNRSIPAVQLTQLRKLSNKKFQGTDVLKRSQ